MLEPLYTADEMRAAEDRYPGSEEELMERAGRAVAEERCGAGRTRRASRPSAAAARTGRRPDRGRDPARCREGRGGGGRARGAEVVLDALFGTGFHGEPRPEAARLIEAINDSGARVVSVDIASGVDASTGEGSG